MTIIVGMKYFKFSKLYPKIKSVDETNPLKTSATYSSKCIDDGKNYDIVFDTICSYSEQQNHKIISIPPRSSSLNKCKHTPDLPFNSRKTDSGYTSENFYSFILTDDDLKFDKVTHDLFDYAGLEDLKYMKLGEDYKEYNAITAHHY